jgi:hypothetical protein
MVQIAEGMIDARPIRPVSTRTAWDNAVARRDELAAAVRETLRREQVEAAVFVSADGNYPPWVRMEAWLPGGKGERSEADERERAELEFVIEVKPYHEHDTVVRAKAVRGKEQISDSAVGRSRHHRHTRVDAQAQLPNLGHATAVRDTTQPWSRGQLACGHQRPWSRLPTGENPSCSCRCVGS